MNSISMARSLALRALRRREVRDRLQQRPASAAAVVGNKQQAAAAAAAGYSTDRLAAYRYRSEGGNLLVPLLAFGAGTWVMATFATRYFMTPPACQRRTAAVAAVAATTPVVEGRPMPVVAASPTN